MRSCELAGANQDIGNSRSLLLANVQLVCSRPRGCGLQIGNDFHAIPLPAVRSECQIIVMSMHT